jgi:oxygen-independent coproporphyrinogen III oxidase
MGTKGTMRGIYIHVPFCVRKCAYCDFYSVPARASAIDRFCRLLVREMDLFRERLPGEAEAPADTVYFGGGTPTVLGPERLTALLCALKERFPVTPDAEITVEANFGTAPPEGLRALRKEGFNRISIGAQSFDPGVLGTLGRIHDAGRVRRAVREARAAGFPSVGIDLIFGIPGQSAERFAADLEETVRLAPDHVSAYALSLEPGTRLQAAVGRGTLRMPSDDLVADMYAETRRALARAGYAHYEISSFAKPRHACRHNLKYWRRDGYRGFGPSAHGLIFPEAAEPGLRTANPPSVEIYERRLAGGHLPWEDARTASRADAWKEALVVGLRLVEGIDLKEISRRYGPPPEPARRAVEALVMAGRLVAKDARLRLPGELLFVSNEVLAALV